MRVAVLMLSYERYDTFKRVLEHNMRNAGYAFDLFIWDNGSSDKRVLSLARQHAIKVFEMDRNHGIAPALNQMMTGCFAAGYDAVHFMANDILEPDGWLMYKLGALRTIPNSGMVANSPGPVTYFPYMILGTTIHPGHVIGNCMVSRKVFERVGLFREDFGAYGPIDNDYNVRCELAGFINYYLPGESVHLDDRNNTLYGYDKNAAVQATWPVHVSSISQYMQDPDSIYIPPPGVTSFDMKDHV